MAKGAIDDVPTDAEAMVVMEEDIVMVMGDMVTEDMVMGDMVMEDMVMGAMEGTDMEGIVSPHIITIIIEGIVHGEIELKLLKIFPWKTHLALDQITRSFMMTL
jgi:hypothetical protein